MEELHHKVEISHDLLQNERFALERLLLERAPNSSNLLWFSYTEYPAIGDVNRLVQIVS